MFMQIYQQMFIPASAFSFCVHMHLPGVVIFSQWRGIMGNTSDRVAADRHGAKAHRSDSSGHKDHEPSSKLVDSTDDPNIFNTHGTESKVLLPTQHFSLHSCF